jgi:hypothetical protein
LAGKTKKEKEAVLMFGAINSFDSISFIAAMTLSALFVGIIIIYFELAFKTKKGAKS